MLHARFQDNMTFGSGNILKVFNIYGHGGHFSHVTKTIFIIAFDHFVQKLSVTLVLSTHTIINTN